MEADRLVDRVAMREARRLSIPGDVPEDFANAVATTLLLGIAGAGSWDLILGYSPDTSLGWIDSILKANDHTGLVHADIDWWEYQIRGH